MIQSSLSITGTRYLSGFTWPDYLAHMRVNRERTEQLFGEIILSSDDRLAFAKTVANHGGRLQVLAMAEDWCGDTVVNLPLIARLAAEVPGIDLRLFIRSASPDLKEAYAADGVTRIPVISFFDADWQEVARWVERSAAAQQRVDVWMAARPGAQALQRSDDPRDRKAYRALMKERLVDMMEWYRAGLWRATLEEWKSLL
jgi:hypothetical protein